VVNKHYIQVRQDAEGTVVDYSIPMIGTGGTIFITEGRTGPYSNPSDVIVDVEFLSSQCAIPSFWTTRELRREEALEFQVVIKIKDPVPNRKKLASNIAKVIGSTFFTNTSSKTLIPL